MAKRIYLVIPSLNPDEKLAKTIMSMMDVGFNDIIVVDDGSDSEHKQFFPTPNNNITLLTHEVNRGKGAALKTAFKYINENCPDAFGVVTADGDGQHAPADVLRCAEMIEDKREIVLGCRDFSGPDVPARSRFGNKTTTFIFKTLCGRAISDTQTGLRGFPACLLGYLCDISGDRFEYETNMLLKCIGDNIAVKEIKIETVYIDDNATSHFRPIRDSIRVYRFLVNYLFSSLASFLIDILFFYAFVRLFNVTGFASFYMPAVATALARAISSAVNYYINRTKVFEHKGDIKSTVFKYYTLAIGQMAVSALAVTVLTYIFSTGAFGSSAIKMLVDTVIFLFSFRIQKLWVFKGEKNMAQYERKPRNKTMKIVKRSLLVFFTVILMIVLTLFSAGMMLAHGPSETICRMLVISAKQASATKWLPHLFLSDERIDSIMADSEKINVDVVDEDNYGKDESFKEIETDDNGLKLVTFTKPLFKGYLLIVEDPARVNVGVSSEHFSSATKGARIFDIADKYDCIAAINGGEFSDVGGKGSGAQPMGITYSFGKRVWSDSLRRTFIGFDKDNNLICTEGMTEKRAEELGIRDGVSFQNGNVLIDSEDGKVKLYYADNNIGTSQRTAIGQRKDGTVLMLVTDGRSADSIGATRNDVIDIMASYGAVSAGMLDGGSSAMLYYEDYYDVYDIDSSDFDEYQLKGLVNKYKAFVAPRTIPTYFIVTKTQAEETK